MIHTAQPREILLLEVCEGEERRRVTALMGAGSVAVLERTSGPDTEVAYGTNTHGHKVMCGTGALAQGLGGTDDEAEALLAAFFRIDEEGSAPLLSDLMDILDAAHLAYSYVAWSGDGDAVFRPAATE